MSTAKLLKQAKKSIAKRDEAHSVATRAHNDAEKCLREALLLSRTVTESMEIYRLSNDKKFSEVAMRKAITLLGTSAKHLWDLALIVEGDGYGPHDDEFRKKKEIILSKISIDWLMSLDKKVPRQFDSELRQRFSKELRQRFEKEARAATSYAQYELISEHYQNLPVDTSGTWDKDGWKPHERPARSYPIIYTGPHF